MELTDCGVDVKAGPLFGDRLVSVVQETSANPIKIAEPKRKVSLLKRLAGSFARREIVPEFDTAEHIERAPIVTTGESTYGFTSAWSGVDRVQRIISGRERPEDCDLTNDEIRVIAQYIRANGYCTPDRRNTLTGGRSATNH